MRTSAKLLAHIVVALAIPQHSMAAPSVDTVRISPRTLLVNEGTVVTATASIADPALITTSVTLVQMAASGSPRNLGSMHDDGLNGDVTAADGIYTLRIPLTSSVPTEIKLQVSAAFRGVILRARSQTVSVFVQDAQAPQRALSALADALTAGDTTTALAFVSPSSNTVKAFSQFTQANFDFLAAALRTATLQSSAPDLRVFVAIVPGRNGQPETVTFRMVPGRNGEWLVENW